MEDRLENDICDLDPNKICDNCCKCLELPQEVDNDYRVIVAEFSAEDTEESGSREREQESAIAALFRDDEDDREELDDIDPLDIPPDLMAEWEAKLAASFRKDEEAENIPQTKLKGSRKKRY